MPHLTQRFWRQGKSTGCGLGLAIVHAITQRYGGSLHFVSQPDGVRAELQLPLRTAEK